MEKPMISPREILSAVEKKGIEKATNPSLALFILAMLAGFYVAFGSYIYVLTYMDGQKYIGAAMFAVGIILVIFTGAELFTGNSIMTYGCAKGSVKLRHVFRNWGFVYFGNMAGALTFVLLAYYAGLLSSEKFETAALAIANKKISANMFEIFLKGILCNIIVVLSIWISFAAKDAISKIFLLWFPITAFVIAGFEHSIANMFFLPVGFIADSSQIPMDKIIMNIVPATLGNIVGGAIIVPFAFYFALKICEKSECKECK